jgi:hypothetical protein
MGIADKNLVSHGYLRISAINKNGFKLANKVSIAFFGRNGSQAAGCR